LVDRQDYRVVFIDRELRRIELVAESGVRVFFPLNAIPDALFQRMLQMTDYSRDNPKESLRKLFSSRILEAVVCTFRASRLFPVNAAAKIAVLTPYDEVIEDTIDDIEGRILSFQGRPFDETIEERFELFRDIYLDESKIDRVRLGALEIYGDMTYKNILREARCSLLFRWQDGGTARSVQLNCIAEIIPPGTPYFRYVRALRSLFSSHFVDLLGGDHVCTYRFWICESIQKDLADRHGFKTPP